MVDTNSLSYFLNQILELSPGEAERYAAFLKRAGLMSKSKGGRGYTGGAPATSTDAAVLVLGLFGARSAETAPEFVKRVGSFNYVGTIIRPDGADFVNFLPPNAEDPNSRVLMKQTFVQCLASIITAIRHGIVDYPEMPFSLDLHSSKGGDYATLSTRETDRIAVAVWAAGPLDLAAPGPVRSAKLPFGIVRAVAEFLGRPADNVRAADSALAVVA
jgi:hypothetical protein